LAANESIFHEKLGQKVVWQFTLIAEPYCLKLWSTAASL